jgi:non-ribosomal peptide synthetase-like protein
VYSAVYVRRWFVDRLLLANLVWINSFFSTLYALPYLRLLRSRMGDNVEVERVAHITPDLLTLCTESFIADTVYLGAPRVYRSQLVVGETRIGRRTFIGNSALLAAGRTVADGCLVAVQSVPPPTPRPARPGSARQRWPCRAVRSIARSPRPRPTGRRGGSASPVTPSIWCG